MKNNVMNEIVKDEIKVYEMMQEHNKLDRSVAKEVLRMDLEVRKKLNKLLAYKKINDNKKMTDAEKDLLKSFVKYSI